MLTPIGTTEEAHNKVSPYAVIVKSRATLTITVSVLPHPAIKSLVTKYVVVTDGEAIGLLQGLQLKFDPTLIGSPAILVHVKTDPPAADS